MSENIMKNNIKNGLDSSITNMKICNKRCNQSHAKKGAVNCLEIRIINYPNNFDFFYL